VNGRLIGKFMTYYDSAHEFSANERELALAIARQPASSIERKRAEELLSESERRLELALDATGSVPWGWDLIKDRLDDWSPQYRKLYGFAHNESPSFERWLAQVHPDDRRRLQDQHMLNPLGDDVWSEEYRIIHPERGECWIGGLGRCLRDESGRALRVTGVNFDITERRRSEEREKLLAANWSTGPRIPLP
jgi:PAS domain S-box-containing protein